MAPQFTNPYVPPSAASSTPTPDPGTKIILVPPTTTWASWTPAERNGVIAACTLAGIALLALLIGLTYLTLKRRRLTALHARCPYPYPIPAPISNTNPNTSGSGSKGGARRRSKSRIRELALLGSGKGNGGTKKGWWGRGERGRARRGIEGLENVELGSAAARAWAEGGVGNGNGNGASRAATAGVGTMMVDGRGGLQGERGSGVSGEEGWMRVLGEREMGRFQLGREVEGDRGRRGG